MFNVFGYTIHIFNHGWELDPEIDTPFTTLVDNLSIDYLVVGGGGEGGGAGGGGGEVIYVTGHNIAVSGTIISPIVGSQGIFETSASESSVFISTAAGGGAGDQFFSKNGACGAGGQPFVDINVPVTGGTGTAGYDGGTSQAQVDGPLGYPVWCPGGGGGMGSAGGNGQVGTWFGYNPGPNRAIGGNGGDGVQNLIFGYPLWYGCGAPGVAYPEGHARPGSGGAGWSTFGSALGSGGNVITPAQPGIVLIRYAGHTIKALGGESTLI